jgi:predicted NAD/FAD-dependent oxidoreductase
MEAVHHDILIIGAGMAGLACATHLAGAGHAPALIDKGRGPGGRMAARRVMVAGAEVTFDHGAQYFTARDLAFRAAVAAWEQTGAAARWPEAGAEAFVGTPGMNGPLKAMAGGLDVRWGVRATGLVREGQLWRVTTDAGTITARTVLVAVPAEQACELLSNAAPDLAAIAASVHSAPCWAVLAAFAGAVPLASAVLRGEAGDAISWAARNAAKPGRAAMETWVIHASPARSRQLLDLPKDEVAAILLEDFRAASGLKALPPTLHCDAHRWLYALPQVASGAPARLDAALQLGLAGDYLHSPRVEGAWLSGRALAQAVSGTSASTA